MPQDVNIIAAQTAPKVTVEQLQQEVIAKVDYLRHGLLTICVITTRNGFTVTGESACASPENYNQTVGENLAYKQAFEKLWPLEGYLLKERLYGKSLNETVVDFDHYDRMKKELEELNAKLEKLVAFRLTDTFKKLPFEERHLMERQQAAMRTYSDMLFERVTLEATKRLTL